MLTTEHVLKIYTQGSDQYDNTMATLWGQLLDRQHVMDILAPQAGERLLEVGVGTGLSFPFYPAGVSLVGIDLTPAMLAGAETRRTTFHGDTLMLRVADTERLPLSDNTFDGVLGVLTLCATPDAEQALHEMYRVCRNGGRIVIFEPALSPNPEIAYFQKELLMPSTTEHGLPKDEIVWDGTRDYLAMGKTLGMTEEHVEWFDPDHMVLSRCLIRWRVTKQ